MKIAGTCLLDPAQRPSHLPDLPLPSVHPSDGPARSSQPQEREAGRHLGWAEAGIPFEEQVGRAEPLRQAKEKPRVQNSAGEGEQTVPCLPSQAVPIVNPAHSPFLQGWIASRAMLHPYSMVSAVAGPPPSKAARPICENNVHFFGCCWLQDPQICVLQVKVWGAQLQGQGVSEQTPLVL